MEITGNDLVQKLLTFKHAPKSNIPNAIISNVDFIILTLHALGPQPASTFAELGKKWRDQDISGQLSPYFCPIAEDTLGQSLHPRQQGQTSYVYRFKPIGARFYVHHLTSAGISRLGHLLDELKVIPGSRPARLKKEKLPIVVGSIVRSKYFIGKMATVRFGFPHYSEKFYERTENFEVLNIQKRRGFYFNDPDFEIDYVELRTPGSETGWCQLSELEVAPAKYQKKT